MGLSVLAYLEMFSNPKDLEINIAKEVKTEKYAVLIALGPEHKYRALLTTLPFTKEFSEAIDAARIILEGAIEVGNGFNFEDFTKLPHHLAALYERIQTEPVLNQDILDLILLELEERLTVSTVKLLEDFAWVA